MGNVQEVGAGPLNTDKDKRRADWLLEAFAGNRGAQLKLKAEVLSTADFADTFAKVQNIVIADELQEVPQQWTKIAKKALVNDFRPAKEVRFDTNDLNMPPDGGGYARIPGTLARVPEGTEFPTVGFTQSGKAFGTSKSGVRVKFTFESFINDDWDEIQNFPNQMARMSRFTEEIEVFRQYFFGTGFNAGVFQPGTNITGNPVLTLMNLQIALAKASVAPPTGPNGIPLVNTITKWSLIVPTSLVMQAEAILNATDIIITDADGTEMKTQNKLNQRITVVENPYMEVLAPGGAYNATLWALVPEGGVSPYGTIVNLAFLRGYETPELRIKYDQGLSLSGGPIGRYEGSFEDDTTQIRLRHIVQANTLNNTFGVAWSKGTGTAGTGV